MLLSVNGRIASVDSGILQITPEGEIVLAFDVVGSYFPARQEASNTASFSFRSQDNVNNKVYIDYGDGYPEQTYDFKVSGVSRRLTFGVNASTTNPALLPAAGTFNVSALYYYQDLPAGIKNTVNDTYGATRKVRIRFEKPQSITEIAINRVSLFNQLPGALARLANLETFSINAAYSISSFPQDFFNTRVRILTLSYVGPIMDDGFPFWVLNSPLVTLTLTDSINLSGSAAVKRFDQVYKLKDSLATLNLGGSKINYTIPQAFGQLYKLVTLSLANCNSDQLRFPADLSGLIVLQSLDLNRTQMPWSEYERCIHGIPSLRTLNLANIAVTSGLDLAVSNNTIQSLRIGGLSSGGFLPAFVNKMLALKTLDLTSIATTALSTGVTSFSGFSACVELTTLILSRNSALPAAVPSWFSGLTKLKTIQAAAVYGTQARVNAFVDSLYSFVVANASITGTTSAPFRGMTIDINGSTSFDTGNSVRPSGIYQQPSGYLQGTTSGTPATQMEKIWVLTFQYGHTWTVKP